MNHRDVSHEDGRCVEVFQDCQVAGFGGIVSFKLLGSLSDFVALGSGSLYQIFWSFSYFISNR